MSKEMLIGSNEGKKVVKYFLSNGNINAHKLSREKVQYVPQKPEILIFSDLLF